MRDSLNKKKLGIIIFGVCFIIAFTPLESPAFQRGVEYPELIQGIKPRVSPVKDEIYTRVNFLTEFTFLFAKEKRGMKEAEYIRLPEPKTKGEMSLEEAVLKRRSKRSYIQKELTSEQISQLLWSAQGVTDKRGYRAAPSAGALYPMEIYIVTKDGLFQYIPQDHLLRTLQKTDLRGELSRAALGQPFVREAPLTIVICAVYQRITSKYGRRGIQYVHIEAGHIAQNLHLQAVALGLGSVPVGAFHDKAVGAALSLPSNHEPLYIIPVGYTH